MGTYLDSNFGRVIKIANNSKSTASKTTTTGHTTVERVDISESRVKQMWIAIGERERVRQREMMRVSHTMRCYELTCVL